MKKNVSIKDIAKLTGTSIATVSMALNGKGRISDEVKKKVLDVAIKNGYEPNRMAVGLRTGMSKVIGLIVESIGGPFFGSMAKVIEQEAEKAGYGIIYGSTNNSLHKGKSVIKMLSNQLVDGFIITPMKGLEDDILKLQADGKPVVLIDGYYPDLDIPHVLVDNFNSVYQAVHFFIKTGYKNIGLITPNLDLIQLHERVRGYKAALSTNGVAVNDRLMLKLPYELEQQKALKYVRNFIRRNKALDCVFFTTNYLGILGLQSITELNMKIPADLSVASFDDNDLFELYPPGITSVRQPTYDIAKSAIDVLLSQLNAEVNDISKVKLLIPGQLIKRGSTFNEIR